MSCRFPVHVLAIVTRPCSLVYIIWLYGVSLDLSVGRSVGLSVVDGRMVYLAGICIYNNPFFGAILVFKRDVGFDHSMKRRVNDFR